MAGEVPPTNAACGCNCTACHSANCCRGRKCGSTPSTKNESLRGTRNPKAWPWRGGSRATPKGQKDNNKNKKKGK